MNGVCWAGTGIPLIEKSTTLVAILLIPKPSEVFVVEPSLGDQQTTLRQTFDVHRMFFQYRSSAVEPLGAGVLE